ncbi:hypothetical protein PIB30_046296 [Stylosanthes scabra]|uniref:SCP domain-containing protein n=1 Tax=Stylosanthes scabra TaxID=79078 RepID=A0ABU6QH07_9FABA|nr:hypothetical protein [Stylosanthes scabra]
MKRLLKIWIVMIISFVSVIPFLLAQNSPKDYLKIHNDARAEVGVKPLKWDSKLALDARKFVKKHAADCVKAISTRAFKDTYGQNSAYITTSEGVTAMAMWVKLKKYYDYKSNSCIDGQEGCRTYTQVVWSESTFLGCAEVKCRDYGGTLVTCLYDPVGNIPNQRPYLVH